jgi:hypothetical protein
LPDHFPSAHLLRLFGDGVALFFGLPAAGLTIDQATLSMGDNPDGLIMSQARDRAAIDNVEDASFGPGGIGRLIE